MGCSPPNTKVSQDQDDPYIQVITQEKLPINVFEAFKSFHNQASQLHQKSIKISEKNNPVDILINNSEGDKNQTNYSNKNDLNGQGLVIKGNLEEGSNADKQSSKGHKGEKNHGKNHKSKKNKQEKSEKTSTSSKNFIQKDANKNVLPEKNLKLEEEDENIPKKSYGNKLPPL